MSLQRITLALAGLACAASCVYAAVCAAADPPKTACVPAMRDQTRPVRPDEVAAQSELVDKLSLLRAAAKTRLDAATAAAQQKMTTFTGDGGTDGGAGNAMSDTAAELSDALRAWNDADARWSCESRELDSISETYARDRLYVWSLEPAVSAAAGAGGAYRLGGAALWSMRDTVFFSEVQLGVGLYELHPASSPTGGKPTAVQGDTSAFQIPIRTYFGNSDVGPFLGVAPTFFSLGSGFSNKAALVAQGGLRLRALSTGDFLGFVDVKLFAEPWFFLDGSTTTVLFGAEIGAGGGPRTSPIESIQWSYGPAVPPHP